MHGMRHECCHSPFHDYASFLKKTKQALVQKCQRKIQMWDEINLRNRNAHVAEKTQNIIN